MQGRGEFGSSPSPSPKVGSVGGFTAPQTTAVTRNTGDGWKTTYGV